MENLKIEDFMSTRLYITISDDRCILGTLVAWDSEQNLLFNDVTEQLTIRPFDSDDTETFEKVTRSLGLVSVPRHTIKSIKILTSDLKSLQDKNTNGADNNI